MTGIPDSLPAPSSADEERRRRARAIGGWVGLGLVILGAAPWLPRLGPLAFVASGTLAVLVLVMSFVGTELLFGDGPPSGTASFDVRRDLRATHFGLLVYWTTATLFLPLAAIDFCWSTFFPQLPKSAGEALAAPALTWMRWSGTTTALGIALLSFFLPGRWAPAEGLPMPLRAHGRRRPTWWARATVVGSTIGGAAAGVAVILGPARQAGQAFRGWSFVVLSVCTGLIALWLGRADDAWRANLTAPADAANSGASEERLRPL